MALIDAYGRPVRKAELTHPQARAGVMGIRQVWAGSVASGLTPPRLNDAPVNGETIVDLYAAVAEALARWEPRIILRRVQLVEATPGRMRFAIDADTVAGPVTLDIAGAVA